MHRIFGSFYFWFIQGKNYHFYWYAPSFENKYKKLIFFLNWFFSFEFIFSANFFLIFFKYVLLILMKFYDEVPWFISLNFHNIHNNWNFSNKRCTVHALCTAYNVNVYMLRWKPTYKWCKYLQCTINWLCDNEPVIIPFKFKYYTHRKLLR